MFSRFLSIFTFSNATLLVALTLSSIAAWYSIIGLTAIFAGAVIPIIIMGGALELAKITTTVWLRKYWNRCGWIMKMYLVPAVVALALLTSMGIFGFLSKAHLDQGVPTGDVAAKVALLDEKIKTERDNIETSRKALTQMDAQVDQMLGRTDSDRGAERAVQIRRQQQKERTALQNDIAKAQNIIAKLNEERAPIASELRKVEAEVGPIKYIAAFIYGDDPDANLLERAVRWVIILLVIVFDPLAIMLVIAANQSKDWDKEQPIEDDKNAMAIIPPKEEDTRPFTEEEIQALDSEPIASWPFPSAKPPKEFEPYVANKFSDIKPVEVVEVTKEEEEVFKELEKKSQPTIEEQMADTVDPEPVKGDSPNFEGIKLADGTWLQTGPEFAEEPTRESKKLPYKKGDGDYVEFEGKSMHIRVLKDTHPEFFLEEDSIRKNRTNFGTEFPSNPHVGDTFVRVDVIPNQVYKHNGARWIKTNKEITDTHLNSEYLQFLVDRIATGEYDPELLTINEQDAVEKFIKSQNS
jgi:hypothetical protein